MKQFTSDMLYILKCAIIGTAIGFALGTCSARANATGPRFVPINRPYQTPTYSVQNDYGHTKSERPTTIRVAVVDSGFDAQRFPSVPLCADSHRDFTGSGVLSDEIGHGNNVTSLIARHATGADYCLIIIKVFTRTSTMKEYTDGLKYVETIGADVVNLSLSGTKYNYEEAYAIERLLDKGTLILAAAGNKGWDLSFSCLVYPACIDSRIIVVGNVGRGNVGTPVDVVINGNKQNAGGITMSGTSQSTAIFTGHIVRALNEKRKTSK